MFKKIVFALLLALPMSLFAQKFGVVDIEAVLSAMPETKAMQTQLTDTSKKYEEEFQKLQEEVNKLYADFQNIQNDTVTGPLPKSPPSRIFPQHGQLFFPSFRIAHALSLRRGVIHHVYLLERSLDLSRYLLQSLNNAPRKNNLAAVCAFIARNVSDYDNAVSKLYRMRCSGAFHFSFTEKTSHNFAFFLVLRSGSHSSGSG